MSLYDTKRKHDFGFDGGLRRARRIIAEFGYTEILEGAIAAVLVDAFELGYSAAKNEGHGNDQSA